MLVRVQWILKGGIAVKVIISVQFHSEQPGIQ